MQRIDRVLAAPAPHSESISTRLPRNMGPWLVAEIKDYLDLEYGETTCNLGQTSHSAPTVLNSRPVSSHPILSMARGKPLVPVVFVPFNA